MPFQSTLTARLILSRERWESSIRPDEKQRAQKEKNRAKRAKVNTELRRWGPPLPHSQKQHIL
eukprot:520660-Prorocentrum_minimum.AAC.3